MSQLVMRRLQPSESRELQAWIAERHYLFINHDEIGVSFAAQDSSTEEGAPR